ncbi:PQ-loop-domain-containing protein [Neoconidiobolus thromboides FSU 785]|nr:PQ-loop-domain-containing protein [Neoconidiobolus thromboides FSU 785]
MLIRTLHLVIAPQANLLLSLSFGYLSIFCWIVVFLPQIYENYKNKSAASLSFYFILFWSLGDVFNLIGSIYQHLILTVVLLPIYFIFSDVFLLGQIAYYSYNDKLIESHNNVIQQENIIETTPILINTTDNNESLVGSFSYNSIHEHQSPSSHTIITPTTTKFKCILPIVFLVLLFMGSNKEIGIESEMEVVWWAQACGWISAFLFCLAKIPQIYHNFKRKSTEGLSMLMFFFCCMGNLTYILSIVIFDQSKKYLLLNLPWLVGAALPFIFDFIIFGQYFAYRHNAPQIID